MDPKASCVERYFVGIGQCSAMDGKVGDKYGVKNCKEGSKEVVIGYANMTPVEGIEVVDK